MIVCPNKNLDSWKQLVSARGENIAYYLFNKYNGKVPESEYKIPDNKVSFDLKSTNLLASPKAEELFKSLSKNKVTGDLFWKKVQELGIPKEQIELLKSFNTYDRDELISNMLAEYSYAVEINPSTRIQSRITRDTTEDEDEGLQFLEPEQLGIPTIQESVPTQYYSNLRVPGGTNYTENEIATPAIIPSIKGHAQFATDKGIGWGRWDDQISYNTVDEVTNRLKQSGRLKVIC